MKKRVVLSLFVVAALALVLSACQTGGVSSLSFNGISGIDAANGTANLSVSALDGSGNVIGSGTLTVPTATVSKVTDAFGSPVSTTYAATATICGSITTTTGDLRAMITLDATGSMASSDPSDLRAEAAKSAFIDRMSGSDQAAVSSFDTGTSPTGSYQAIHVYQDLTSDHAALKTAVDDATFAGSLTNLWDAGVDSVDYFANQGVTGGNRVVVLLTDGLDTSSSNSPSDVISAATSSGVRVYTVGLGSSLDSADLIDIASQTGGTYGQVVDPADLSGLFDGIFNASQGSGCVQVKFSPVPTSGHIITGTLTVKVNGTPVTATYQVAWP